MNKRDAVRYDSELLPESLRKVNILWEGGDPVESNVVNCCSLGMRVTIDSLSSARKMPNKNDILKVHVPMVQQWLTGMCVFITNEEDNSISMGIYLVNPSEQNHFKEYLYNSLKHIQPHDVFIPYEWEELVGKLCNSDDPHLNHIGLQEMDNINRLNRVCQ